MPDRSDLPDDLLSPREAARLLKTHISSIYRWVMRGRLKAYRVAGARYLVSRKDLAGVIEVVEPRKRAAL